MLLAGVDIGTLTCRLLIADVSMDGTLTEVESDRRILRLGEGVDQHRRLTPAAIERVVKTLSEWQSRISAYPITSTIAVATSAVREARNREEFIGWVKREAGIDIEVLSGEEEARRTLVGIRFGLPHDVRQFLGVDIGGGSTEFILAQDTDLLGVDSLALGVVRLTERFFMTDPPGDEAIKTAERYIRNELERARVGMGNVTDFTLVGTAGTITTLAAMAQALPTYDPARIHNYWLGLPTIRELEEELRSRPEIERGRLVGLERGREGVILAGTVILRTVMETLGFEHCLVSDYGLREGILVHYAGHLKNLNPGT